MKQYDIYMGTQTIKESKGIYGLQISNEGKIVGEAKMLAEQASPTYFYITKDHAQLFAVSEPGEGQKGEIRMYRVDPATKALRLESQRMAAGRGLCHITMDAAERYAVVVCYEEATVQVYPLDADKKLTEMFCLRRHSGSGPVVQRQEKAHAHSVTFSPDGLYAVVCDLGTDQLVVYTMNHESGKLHRGLGQNVDMPAGSGPRHLVYSPDGRFLYVACELSSEVVVLSYETDHGYNGKKTAADQIQPSMRIVQRVSTLSPEFASDQNYPSAIRISQNGRDLYVSNRGEDTIAHFRIHEQSGEVELKQSYSTRGWYPRDFILTNDERFLIAANQLSENVVVFRRNEQTGELVMTDEQTTVHAPMALIQA